MMRDEYRMLKRENDLRASSLTDADQDELQYARGLLQSVSANFYEIERIRKDLIGMAARAEIAGGDLRSSIGADRESFYRGLAENVDKGNPFDYAGQAFPSFYLLFAILTLPGLLLQGPWHRSTNLLTLLLEPLVIGGWVWLMTQIKIARLQKAKEWLRTDVVSLALSAIVIAAMVAILALLSWQKYLASPLVPVPVPNVVELGFNLLLAGSSKLYILFRYNAFARKHPWRETDE